MQMAKDTQEIIDRAEELCFLCEEDEAERIVRQALELNPNNLGLQTELAIILSRQGYDNRAEGILKEVVRKDPYNERAVASLGRMWDNSLRTREAEVLFSEYLKKRPSAHIVFDDLCRLWFGNDEQEKALLKAREHVAEYSDQVHAYDALRYVLVMLEDELMAELAENPTDHTCIIEYGKNLIEQYSIIKKLLDIMDRDDESTKYLEDIHEDLTRLKGELADLEQRYTDENVARTKEIQLIFDDIKN